MCKHNEFIKGNVPMFWWWRVFCFLGIPAIGLVVGKLWKGWVLSDGWFSIFAVYEMLRWECLLWISLVLGCTLVAQHKHVQKWITGCLGVLGGALWFVTVWEHLCFLRWGSIGDVVFLWQKGQVWWIQGWSATFPDFPSWLRWFWLLPVIFFFLFTWLDWRVGDRKNSSSLSSDGWMWRWGIVVGLVLLILPPNLRHLSIPKELLHSVWPSLVQQGLGYVFLSSEEEKAPSKLGAPSSNDDVGQPPPSSVFGSVIQKEQARRRLLFETRYAQLFHTTGFARRNVVMVLLDSTKMASTTLVHPNLWTTPFLAELAKESKVVEYLYGVADDSTRSVIAALCGIYPRILSAREDARAANLPARCLPFLLDAVGYQTAFFQPSSLHPGSDPALLSSLGFAQMWGGEDFSDHAGFFRINQSTWEDRAMLRPALEWMEQAVQKRQSFFVTLLMQGATFHKTLLPGIPQQQFPGHTGQEPRSYLNALREQDRVLAQLVQELKRRDWMNATLLVVVGLRGGTSTQHSLVAENMRVPGLLYAPGLWSKQTNGERILGLRQHIDLVPSLLSWLEFSAISATWPGQSLSQPVPRQRRLWMTGAKPSAVSAFLQATTSPPSLTQFLFHHYRQQPQFWGYKNGMVSRPFVMEEEQRRQQRAILLWQEQVQTIYRNYDREILQTSRTWVEPHTTYPSGAILGSLVRVVGTNIPPVRVRVGGVFSATVVFQALHPVPSSARLLFFLELQGDAQQEEWEASPVRGNWPLHRWRVGEFVRDTLVMRFPSRYRAGSVMRLYVKMISKKQGYWPISHPGRTAKTDEKRGLLLAEFAFSE